jgi:hypothetical protein
MDFAEDRLVTGRKFFALLVKDEAAAFALEVAVAPSFTRKYLDPWLKQLGYRSAGIDFFRHAEVPWRFAMRRLCAMGFGLAI